jgi:cation:H+ antiporter
VLALLLALDGRIGRVDGTVLLLLAIAYTAFVVRQGRREGKAIASAREVVVEVPVRPHWGRDVLLIVGGLVLLVLGARWLVASATTIARDLGISELVIGLTIVAAGTSLPEVATSVVASLRGERDIAVGNVVGSNLFNVLMVLGLAGELAPGGLAVSPAVLRFDLPVMVAVAVACLPIFFTGHLVARWEGALFLGYYALYLAYLLLSATGHAALGPFRAAMLWFVLPLTAITLATLSARAWRAPRDGARAA